MKGSQAAPITTLSTRQTNYYKEITQEVRGEGGVHSLSGEGCLLRAFLCRKFFISRI